MSIYDNTLIYNITGLPSFDFFFSIFIDVLFFTLPVLLVFVLLLQKWGK